MLNLCATLIKKLGEASVNYCHWKSNESLTLALNGEGDLDFLVAPRDAPKFLKELGISIIKSCFESE